MYMLDNLFQHIRLITKTLSILILTGFKKYHALKKGIYTPYNLCTYATWMKQVISFVTYHKIHYSC